MNSATQIYVVFRKFRNKKSPRLLDILATFNSPLTFFGLSMSTMSIWLQSIFVRVLITSSHFLNWPGIRKKWSLGKSFLIEHHVYIKFPEPESSRFYIFLGLNTIPVTVTFIGLAYMCWQHCSVRCKRCKDLEKWDINDIYGIHRGWDGEGDYGNGDKVYVSNPGYQSYNYMESNQWEINNNSQYSSI